MSRESVVLATPTRIQPTKTRQRPLVFDYTATYPDICLNDALMQGQDLVNGLIFGLTRFRRESISLAADVKSMFHQVRIKPKDSGCFRFLVVWWESLINPDYVSHVGAHIWGDLLTLLCCLLRETRVQLRIDLIVCMDLYFCMVLAWICIPIWSIDFWNNKL